MLGWYVSSRLRTENRRSVYLVVLILFVETENRLYKIGFSVAQKKRNRKNDFVFSVVLFYVPVVKKCLHLSIETPSGMDTWTASHTQQQQQHQRQRKGGVDNVGRLNTSTYYTLQCCMQVHNPLIFHYWFPCILRLSVTPLPKMKSCLLYTSPSPRDQRGSRMPSSA